MGASGRVQEARRCGELPSCFEVQRQKAKRSHIERFSFPVTALPGVADLLISALKTAWIISIVLKETSQLCRFLCMGVNAYRKRLHRKHSCYISLLSPPDRNKSASLQTSVNHSGWRGHGMSSGVNHVNLANTQGGYNTHPTNHSIKLNHLLAAKVHALWITCQNRSANCIPRWVIFKRNRKICHQDAGGAAIFED